MKFYFLFVLAFAYDFGYTQLARRNRQLASE